MYHQYKINNYLLKVLRISLELPLCSGGDHLHFLMAPQTTRVMVWGFFLSGSKYLHSTHPIKGWHPSLGFSPRLSPKDQSWITRSMGLGSWASLPLGWTNYLSPALSWLCSWHSHTPALAATATYGPRNPRAWGHIIHQVHLSETSEHPNIRDKETSWKVLLSLVLSLEILSWGLAGGHLRCRRQDPAPVGGGGGTRFQSQGPGAERMRR